MPLLDEASPSLFFGHPIAGLGMTMPN